MKDETKAIGDCAVARLSRLLDDIEADTTAVVQTNDIPTIVTHFAYVRELHRSLKECVGALGEHVNGLSYNTSDDLHQSKHQDDQCGRLGYGDGKG